MSLIIVFVGVLATFAVIGRLSVSARERLPIRRWGIKDILDTVVQGLFLCLEWFPMSPRFARPRTCCTAQETHALARIRRVLLAADTDDNHGRL